VANALRVFAQHVKQSIHLADMTLYLEWVRTSCGFHQKLWVLGS